MDPRLAAALAALCLGAMPIPLKRGFKSGTSSTQLAVVVSLLVGPPLYVLMAPFGGGFHLEQLTPTAVGAFVVGGLMGTYLGRYLTYSAVRHLGAARAAAIKNCSPLVATLLAFVVLGENIGLERWLAIGAIVGGVLLIGREASAPGAESDPVGILYAIGGAVSFGLRPVILKAGFQEADLPLTAAMIGASTALLLYLVEMAARGRLGSISWRSPGLGWFAASGLLQALAFVPFNIAVAGGELSVVYPIMNSAPLATLALSRWLLREVERTTWLDVVAVLAIVVGVSVLAA
ncbi:MAG: DMT family transporter [Chloroflexi bacterium]|nr:DMT family transporter [Chloroflexota bacterium]